MTDFGGSNTPYAIRDLWQTPDNIFHALDAEFGFYLDAEAKRDSALCAHYLSEKDDALSCDWTSYGAIFCNPPYSNITPWINKAAEQCKKQRQPIVMLLPADTSTGWFRLALESADEVRIIIGGRLSFINNGTGKPGKNGNSKGSLLIIWRPYRTPCCSFTTVSRETLEFIGNDILEGVKAA
ncbi:phage N-6-adenine-methyltransferase [Limnobaculum xujianqingii]|uniref:phage N-6-adenine-methyltransferase n=1 Tax=Limnobaculum xujianqingii TaxID=2738837 RepID=UPI001127F006|nr:phage N-6-adenine-methyltransferase [Limnobaculum xujianqingii]